MVTNETYQQVRSKVLQNLSDNLSKDLLYHCVEHTIDVEQQAERIARSEQVNDDQDLLLLKVACLYHDTGFLFTYKDEHEAAGCNFARKELAVAGFTEKEIDIICGMIMATRIPQNPQSKLEQIICDADLDYLGREDFLPVSQNLFLELKAKKVVVTENDWNRIQVKFFKQHHYFTTTTIQLREAEKQRHLEMIEAVTEMVE